MNRNGLEIVSLRATAILGAAWLLSIPLFIMESEALIKSGHVMKAANQAAFVSMFVVSMAPWALSWPGVRVVSSKGRYWSILYIAILVFIFPIGGYIALRIYRTERAQQAVQLDGRAFGASAS